MQELSIQSQPLTPEEQAALAQQGGQPPAQGQQIPAAQPAYQAAGSTNQLDYIAELERLAELRDKGIVTDEDYEAKKKQLLGL